MMVLKIVLLYLMISGGCRADIFECLNEAQVKEGKAMACVSDTWKEKTLRTCHGVLWRHSSLIVRASCLKYAQDPYVQKGTSNCTYSNSTTTALTTYCDDEMCIRHVIAIYMHPRFPETDLALLRLNAPYFAETRAYNKDLEQKLDEWEQFISNFYVTATEGTVQMRHYQMYTTPVKMILITVILPTVSFILFFLYVIFYTGSSDKNMEKDIPYTNLTNEEDFKANI